MSSLPSVLALESRTTFRWLIIAVFVGLVFAVAGLWAFGFASIFTALLWAIACLVAGGAIGFLFGIPRVLQQDSPTAGNSTPDEADDGPGYRLLVNTNLEQISDWLTKIIVGVGLIQLHELPGVFLKAAVFVGDGLGEGTTVLATALLGYFTVTGFLCGYLMTRLYLAGAFARADASVSVGGSELSLPEAVRQMAKLIPDLLGRDDTTIRRAPPHPDDGIDSARGDGDQDEPAASEMPSPRSMPAPIDSTAPAPPPAIQPQRSRALLWVDDNPTNNSFLIEHLNRQGVRVVTARTTKEALDLLKQQDFQRVVTDLGRVEGRRFDQTAGLNLIRAIRTHDPSMPVAVYSSTRSIRVYAADALEAGADIITDNGQNLLQALETTG